MCHYCNCSITPAQGEKGEPGVTIAADGSIISAPRGPQGPKGIKVGQRTHEAHEAHEALSPADEEPASW